MLILAFEAITMQCQKIAPFFRVLLTVLPISTQQCSSNFPCYARLAKTIANQLADGATIHKVKTNGFSIFNDIPYICIQQSNLCEYLLGFKINPPALKINPNLKLILGILDWFTYSTLHTRTQAHACMYGRVTRVVHCAKSPKVHGFWTFSHSFGPMDFTK